MSSITVPGKREKRASTRRVAVLIGILSTASPAAADPSDAADPGRPALIALDWEAPAECPSRDIFHSYVAALVEHPPAEPVRVRVRVHAREREFVAVIQINHGDRELHDPSCAAVVKSAALVVATAIDTLADTRQPAPTRVTPGLRNDDMTDGETDSVTDGENPLTPELGPTVDLFRPRGYVLVGLPVDLSLRIMVGGDSGLLPDLAASIQAMAALQYRRVRIEVGASHVFEQRAPLPDAPEVGGDIFLNMVKLRGCIDVFRGRIEAALCGAGELGAFHASGYGLAMPLVKSERHMALGGGLSLAWAFQKPIYIRLDTDVFRPLVRPRFRLCTRGTEASCEVPLDTFWQPATSIVRAVVGVEVFFR